MKTLPKNWITEGWIDFEYKKYQLLAYLQSTEKEFKEVKLYPSLSDLIEHHKTLKELESGKTDLKNLFPRALTGIDIQQGKLHFESPIQEGQVMAEIAQITSFAIPRLQSQIEEGRSIFDFVEEQLEFEPVGILPLYNREGYMLVTQENRADIHAFRYKSNFLQLAGERFRNITIWLVGIFRKSLVLTLEKLKMELIRESKDLPNPATWRLHSTHALPLEETLLPIGKRLLLKSVRE